MLHDIQTTTVSSRPRFAASVAVFVASFVGWNIYCQSAQLSGNVQLAGDLVHDFLLVTLCALRFRYLRLSEAWSLLVFLPLVNVGVVIFLIARGEPADERYSGT